MRHSPVCVTFSLNHLRSQLAEQIDYGVESEPSVRPGHHAMFGLNVPVVLHYGESRAGIDRTNRSAALAVVPGDVQFISEMRSILILGGDDPFICVCHEKR